MERADLDQWRPKDVARLLALVEGQRRYFQDLIAALPVGVLVLSQAQGILIANAAIRRMFNLPRQGPLNLSLGSVLPAWVLSRVEQVLRTGVADNIAFEAVSRRLQMSAVGIQGWDEESGREALLTIEELAVSPTASGRADLLPVPSPGITELMEDVSAVLWAVDARNMRPVLVSREAEKLLGFPSEFWVTNASFWIDRVYPADRERVIEFYQRAVKCERESSCEFRSVRADGQTIWLRETVRVVRDSTNRAKYLAGVTLDVTERRMVERQLIQDERIQAMQKLASRMAHDLNNMLMILEGNAEEILNGLPAASPLRAEVEAIIGAAQRITGLTGSLLAFTRRAPIAGEVIELEAALSAVTEKLGLERKGVWSRTRVNANATLIEQVVTAIVNAVRKAGPPAPPIEVEVSSVEIGEDLQRESGPLAPGNYAAIAISVPGGTRGGDFGEAVFERILPEKGDARGTGLALALAYGVIRQWGGDISVAAGVDEGTIFRIFLERGNAPNTVLAVAEPTEARGEPALAKILIVEDEAGIRALVQKFLRKRGYQILEAANGEEAVAMLQGSKGTIDLLITDMMMPQMGGRELVERLRAEGRDLKILYISGYTDDASVYAAELPAGSAFLQKPFTLSSLLEKVRGLLGT
jgi:two-component system, cell cycle sensor histidine kinase and response regulator CckA